jgi:hypothetical protein
MTVAGTKDVRLALLINTRCGHVCGVANVASAAMVEQRRAALALAGFTGWEVQQREATDAELIGMVRGTRCGHCSLDGQVQ